VFFLKLTGGKPALHLQFGEVLELATSHRFSVGLLTNLPLLSEKGLSEVAKRKGLGSSSAHPLTALMPKPTNG